MQNKKENQSKIFCSKDWTDYELLDTGEGEKLEEKFKVGDDLKVKLLKVDSIQHKIALSIKGV